MYEIYSNVEDPDGFYGIKTRDTSKALSRQLQHEGEHWRSLGLNSAAIQGRGSSSVIPAMRDLHHLGFDRMASAVFSSLQTSSSSSSTTKDKQVSSDPLFFELAWRTGDWDLPTSNLAKPNSGELFYTVLRAVHRERDSENARRVVKGAIGVEMGRLKELGLERMAQIKEKTGRLLCLREIDNWLGKDMQSALEKADGTDEGLMMFAMLENSFRQVWRGLEVRYYADSRMKLR
jgi:ataxia telangiectasia mutated family protein